MKKSTAILVTLISIIIFYTGKISAQKPQAYIFIPNNSNFVTFNMGSGNFNIPNDRLIQWNIYKNISHLSSGKRIITAGDDPSGLAISEKMQSIINALKQESMNAEDYRNYLNFYESSIGQIQKIIKRIRELAVKASNGIYGEDDREMIQSEALQLIDEINSNAKFSQYNTKKIMTGITSTNLGLDSLNITKHPGAAIGIADKALKKLQLLRSFAGTKSNILTYQIKGKTYYLQNMTESMSKILDTDIADQVIKLTANGIALKVKYGIIIKSR